MSQEERPHGGKAVTIIVNGTQHEVEREKLTYEDLVNLAFDNKPPTGEMVSITVTYSKGEDGKQGSLQPGDDVKVKDGMIFNVKATDRS